MLEIQRYRTARLRIACHEEVCASIIGHGKRKFFFSSQSRRRIVGIVGIERQGGIVTRGPIFDGGIGPRRTVVLHLLILHEVRLSATAIESENAEFVATAEGGSTDARLPTFFRGGGKFDGHSLFSPTIIIPLVRTGSESASEE